ncbi:uncharacterized protein GGS25DRAFT_530906 [Hypoxylon fragiforme]|uniref:uncharacterized protein n=1 Tax=Hypoxylon fragiforme TaxID=63214 RepID=UPI0020C6ED55|nr:uncharacterized protein GGS25DRAFT_530906 [Hypoxylon fragiforme]KAI2609908.1 hypothetical protein GGS25DRAFT_530906 [Hypoxylon fragiforme]
MPSVNLEYPKLPYSKVNRYDSRASYALETIHHLINTCPILHVSFQDPSSPFPTILPMIGQMGSFSRPSADTGDVLDLYLHGYVSSRLMNMSRKATTAAATGGNAEGEKEEEEEEEEEEQGLPVSVSAAHLDGLVLALTPNSHTYNYRSAVLFGRATLVADAAEKLYAMQLVTDSVVPGRYRRTRVPPSPAEMQSTSVLRVRVAAGSAKTRAGGPKDDRSDLADQELRARVWTGVLPVHYVVERPVAGEGNRVDRVPEYLEEFVREFNCEARVVAEGAAGEGEKGKVEG